MRRTVAGTGLALACAVGATTGCTGGSDEADVEEVTPARDSSVPGETDPDCPVGVDTDGDGDPDPDPMLPDCYVVDARW